MDEESPSRANNWTLDHRRRRTVQRGIIVEEEQLDEGSSSQADDWMVDYRPRRIVQREIIVVEEQLNKGSSSQANNLILNHRRRRTVQRGPSSQRNIWNTVAAEPSRRTVSTKASLQNFLLFRFLLNAI